MSMKKMRSPLCLLLMAVLLLLPACGQDDGDKAKKNGEVLLPISVNGKEIRVGETTVQTLLDEGLDVSWVDEDYSRVTVDPAAQLEANAYYTGLSMKVTDNMFFSISLVTDEEEVPLGQAVIARAGSTHGH